MQDDRFNISAGAIIVGALLYYLLDADKLLAIFIPVAVHELGHIVALKCFGLSIKAFKLELKGCCIEYSGLSGTAGNIIAALSGPLAGLLYALAASYGAQRLESQWLELTAGVSILLTAFNLLPALPLDGGRVLSFTLGAFISWWHTEQILYWIGLVLGTAMLSIGLWLMVNGWGVAMALTGVWLLLEQNCSEGIVKPAKML